MAGLTTYYGLQKLSANEAFATNDYKFTNADQDVLAALAYLGAEGHRHTGAVKGSSPDTAPSLTLVTTSGSIPSGTRVYYKYTLVDSVGKESLPSPEAYVDTPPPVGTPAAPTLETSTTGGTLIAGNYFYALSAYTGTSNTFETQALNPAYITVPETTITNKITLTLPTLPAGAVGYNVYRRSPGGDTYYWVTSLAIGATPMTTWTDTGFAATVTRLLPRGNTTNSSNSVVISVPGATPVVPAGYTWKIYRSYVNGSYTNSVLKNVVEQTSESSGIIMPSFTDTGLVTTVGSPPLVSQLTGSPPKINFADSVEVQGALPLARISGFPMVVTFFRGGTLTPVTGQNVWICEFPAATIVGVRAVLARGSTPASQQVIIDVNKVLSGTSTYTTIYTTTANRPRVQPGQQVGARTTPDVKTLAVGDGLSVDIIQAGGGASPTDRDMLVNVFLIVHSFTSTLSHLPGSVIGIS